MSFYKLATDWSFGLSVCLCVYKETFFLICSYFQICSRQKRHSNISSASNKLMTQSVNLSVCLSVCLSITGLSILDKAKSLMANYWILGLERTFGVDSKEENMTLDLLATDTG